MEHNNHNQRNGSGNGFLLGVIVGVLLTLLFTTKRGRAIFKEILEKGVEKFSNLEELLRMSEEDIDEESEENDDYIPAEPMQISQPAQEKKEAVKKAEEKVAPPQSEKTVKQNTEASAPPTQEPSLQAEKHAEKSKTSGKRWFRGLRKKS